VFFLHVKYNKCQFLYTKNCFWKQLQTWRLRDQVRSHRIHILTLCINRVAFVCPAYKLLGENINLDVTSWLCRVQTRGLRVFIVCPSVWIEVSSVVNWFSTYIGANFSRNKNFHIRVSIWCVFRDSVTPANNVYAIFVRAILWWCP